LIDGTKTLKTMLVTIYMVNQKTLINIGLIVLAAKFPINFCF